MFRRWYTPIYRVATYYQEGPPSKPDMRDTMIEHTEEIGQYKDIHRPQLDLEIFTYKQNGKIVEQWFTYYPEGDRKTVVFREKVDPRDFYPI